MRGVFITATDTGVGKTVLAAAICAALAERGERVAAYKAYDVLLVNAIFDGMNLVAKEAPLVNQRDGVLILSENAGSHEELAPWAISVNPFDIQQQADAIYQALTMGAGERRRRLEAIRTHLREHDMDEWIDGQLRDLDEATDRSETRISA